MVVRFRPHVDFLESTSLLEVDIYIETMYFIVLFLVAISVVHASINVIASVRGKKYEIEAETVQEFTAKVESVVNLSADEQSVLFRGKVLSPSDVLAEVGVASGDVLMVVKGRRARPKVEESEQVIDNDLTTSSSQDDVANPFAKMPQGAGDMESAMKQMDTLLDSTVFDEYFKDDESLEKARMQLLDNLDQYEKAMPGFKNQAQEIASDPEKWRAAMTKARDQIALLRQQREQFRAGQSPSAKSPPPATR